MSSIIQYALQFFFFFSFFDVDRKLQAAANLIMHLKSFSKLFEHIMDASAKHHGSCPGISQNVMRLPPLI